MASFECDQAEGLRRLLAGPRPRIFTFLSTTSVAEKSTMLVNLGASLAECGRDVVLLDACASEQGIVRRMGADVSATLLDVSRQHRAFDQAVQMMPQGFRLASLTVGSRRAMTTDVNQVRRLSNTFHVLAAQADVVIVDAELDQHDALPLSVLANGDIVIQVSPAAESIKDAYSLIKRLYAQLGRRPFGILVTGADEEEAAVVYQNLAQAASRYLAVSLFSIGSIPNDEQVTRAARLGRAVIDAFPRAGAATAFRRLAQRFAVPDAMAGRVEIGV